MNSSIKYKCRVCLSNGVAQLHSLNEKDTRKIFEESTSILTDPHDNYPQHLCTECYAKCLLCHIFRTQAVAAHRRLIVLSDPISPTEIKWESEDTVHVALVDWEGQPGIADTTKRAEGTKTRATDHYFESDDDDKSCGIPDSLKSSDSDGPPPPPEKRSRSTPKQRHPKPFKCKDCRLSFVTKYDLSRHQRRVHTAPRRLKIRGKLTSAFIAQCDADFNDDTIDLLTSKFKSVPPKEFKLLFEDDVSGDYSGARQVSKNRKDLVASPTFCLLARVWGFDIEDFRDSYYNYARKNQNRLAQARTKRKKKREKGIVGLDVANIQSAEEDVDRRADLTHDQPSDDDTCLESLLIFQQP